MVWTEIKNFELDLSRHSFFQSTFELGTSRLRSTRSLTSAALVYQFQLRRVISFNVIYMSTLGPYKMSWGQQVLESPSCKLCKIKWKLCFIQVNPACTNRIKQHTAIKARWTYLTEFLNTTARWTAGEVGRASMLSIYANRSNGMTLHGVWPALLK